MNREINRIDRISSKRVRLTFFVFLAAALVLLLAAIPVLFLRKREKESNRT